MRLLEKLKREREACWERYKRLENNLAVCQRELEQCDKDWGDYNVTIAALEPAEPVQDVTEFVDALVAVSIPDDKRQLWETSERAQQGEIKSVLQSDEQQEQFLAEKETARKQLEADHALTAERWKYRVCWDGYGDRFGDSHYDTLEEAREELKKRDTDESVIAATLHEAYSDGEGGVLWREIGRCERPDNEQAVDGYAPVIGSDRAALDEDMHDAREQLVEGYAPVTNPEADAAARAFDWYDAKAVAARHKKKAFAIFRSKDEA